MSRAKVGAYIRLMRLHRPIGSLLLLWPTLWALWFAGNGHPRPLLVVVFVIGVVLMRSAGCVINDYADADFDGHVWRTRTRPLATGEVTRAEALRLFAALCLAAAVLTIWLNRYALMLAVVAVGLAVSYPFFKRVTHLPQLWLGLAFGWGIPMAFAAERDMLPGLVWVLLTANVFWTLAYDTVYAMADRADDIKIGVKSAAILFGRWDRLLVGVSQGISLMLLAAAGYLTGLGPFYDAGVVGALGFAVYEQWLIAGRDPQRCLRAFFNNNWFGGSIFAGLVAAYLGR